MTACVAFGPGESFFFNSPNQWTYGNLPPAILQLIQRQPRILCVNEVALGEYGAFAVTYQEQDGSWMLLRNNLPPALEAWLINPSSWTIARDLESLAISLGTQGTFFAIDNNGPMWGNLPPDMDAILQAKRDPTTGAFLPNEDPQHVTFGFNQAWIYINSAGKGNWDLRGQNSQLNDFLNKTPSLSDKYPCLDSYRPGISVLMIGTGACPSRVSKSQSEQQKAFAADWKACCEAENAKQRQLAAQQQQQQQQRVAQRPQRKQKMSTAQKLNTVNQGLRLTNTVLNITRRF